jgi:hypothetical protein
MQITLFWEKDWLLGQSGLFFKSAKSTTVKQVSKITLLGKCPNKAFQVNNSQASESNHSLLGKCPNKAFQVNNSEASESNHSLLGKCPNKAF